MKPSNQMLVALLIFMTMALVGANLHLKAQYEKIDFKDPFYGYSVHPVRPFKVVQLRGSFFGLIKIQPAKNFEVRPLKVEEERNLVHWHSQGDTLVLTRDFDDGPYEYQAEKSLKLLPTAYILAPALQAVYSSGVSSLLTGWQAPSWLLSQQGSKSGMFLSNNTIGSVWGVVGRGGLLQIDEVNRLGKTAIQVIDSSRFVAKKDVFASLQVKGDSLASINLPGPLHQKMLEH